ncbi:MAG: response regulator [Gammaproteobacteria bacterium]|nr:response regulator [Gammaproteobacteria bacterium]
MNATEQAEHILVVDDDAEIRRLLKQYLEKSGFRVTAVADGKAMWSVLNGARVSLIVLDLMLPGEDGLALCRRLRVDSQIPVIMLTALGEDTDRIVGLEMGADDYLPKPFNPRELLARIKSVLRRAPAAPEQPSRLRRMHFAGWTLDLTARHLVSPDGVVVPLGGAEYRLLYALLTHPNRVLSRDQLLDLAHGREAVPFDRSVDVQVGRLRRLLNDDAREPAILKTVRGEGYILTASVNGEA